MKTIRNITNGTAANSLNGGIKDKNKKVYNLTVGDPKGIPTYSWSEAYNVITNQGFYNHYDNVQGNLQLRERLNIKDFDTIIGNGAKPLIYMALMATCFPGDTVLIIGPCWSSYIEICKILGLKVKQYIPKYSFRWENDLFELKELFNKNISLVIFNNPNNPTGLVEGEVFVNELINICELYNCWLLADEVYSDYIYSDAKFESCLGKSKNVIYINSFSKCAAVAGWRLGYCIAVPQLIKQMTLIQSQISGPPNTLIQRIALTALNQISDFSIKERNNYEEIRDYLASIKLRFNVYKPFGAFYFYIPVENTENTCKQLAEKNIIVTPGDEYGVKNTIRISFAQTSLGELKEIEQDLITIN